MKYILEPMVFALDGSMSEREFKRYVNRIILWDEWMQRYPDDMYVLSDTCEQLSRMKLFPVYTVFDSLVKKYKIDYVDAQTLNKVIQRIVSKSSKIDKCGDKDIDYDIIINILALEGDACIIKKRKQTIERILKCLYCMLDGTTPDTFVIFGFDRSMVIGADVEAQTIEESSCGLIVQSDKQHISIQCWNSLADWFKSCETPLTILRQTETKEDIALAVRVSIFQRGKMTRVMEAFENFDYIVQESFVDDFNKAHYQSNPTVQNSLMESMGHTVLNMQMGKREAFRVDKGGNSKQLNCNGWNAWRRFVTTSIKMQYWQKNNQYKFANVKEHDLFECKWEEL